MFIIAIKNLELCLDNLYLLIGKSIICFEFLAQNRETGKQTAVALY